MKGTIINKDGRADWEIDLNFKVSYYNDEMEEEEKTYGGFYVDDTDKDYVYYHRTHYMCSDVYERVVRIKKEKMADVLHYLAENPPTGLDWFLNDLDGCEPQYEWEH